jgi:hypothetical protein
VAEPAVDPWQRAGLLEGVGMCADDRPVWS